MADAPLLPVRHQPCRCSPMADAVGPLGPGADVERSWRRCGAVLAQMWSGPGADVERSWRRCGGSPSPVSAVPVPPSAVPVQSRCSPALLHLLRCRPRASASDATFAFIHVPIASQRMSLGVAPTGATPPATPPVSAAHGGGGLAGPLPVRGVRRRRSPCRRRQPRGARTVGRAPSAVCQPVHRMRCVRPSRRASLSAEPSRRTLSPV